MKNKIFKTAIGSQTSKSNRFNIFGTALTGLTTDEGGFSSTNNRRFLHGLSSKNEALYLVENRDIQQINEFKQKEEEQHTKSFMDAKLPFWALPYSQINKEAEKNARLHKRMVSDWLTLLKIFSSVEEMSGVPQISYEDWERDLREKTQKREQMVIFS